MKPNIINKCKKTYRIDVEKFAKRIVSKIPDKFLEGLDHISLLDFGGKDYPMCRYIAGNSGSKWRRIEIYLDNPDLSKIPFFSPLAINIHLLLAINRHIAYLKQQTEDREILSINTNKVNYEWMYLGVWNPLVGIIKFIRNLTAQRLFFKTLLRKWTNEIDSKTDQKAKGSSPKF